MQVLGALPAKSEPDPASGPDEFELDLAKCFGNKSKDVTAKDVLCIASFVACSKWFTSLCMCKLVPPADSGVKIVFNAVAANQVREEPPTVAGIGRERRGRASERRLANRVPSKAKT